MKNNEVIRVVHIIGKMVGGGVESFLLNYYKNIDRTKIQFDFIIDSDSTLIPRNEIELLGGKIYEVTPYQHIFSYIRDIRKILKENNYKIVHAHMNTLSIFPLYAAWRERIPIRIAHSHSTTNKKEWKKNILKNLLKPFSKVFATDYFACSEHAGRWLFGNKAFNEGKVKIIRNAINTDNFKYNKEIRNSLREELGLKDKFVLGHAGRFVKQKNHEFLIDLFNILYKENHKFKLLLIGQGPLENQIKNKVNSLKLNENVIFCEQRDDVNRYMQAMDCFVFPSLYEGLGIVVIEAQCAGLKCICSTEVPKETKMSNLITFVELSNIEKWKEKIMEENYIRENKCKEIKDNGYDITVESQKLVNKYMELIK